MKVLLTDRAVRALKPAPPGKRNMIWDTAVPSFGIRVTDKGSASFIRHAPLEGRPAGSPDNRHSVEGAST